MRGANNGRPLHCFCFGGESYRRQRAGRCGAREWHGRRLAADSGRVIRGVSREAAIADDGVVLTGELDHDLVSHDAAPTDTARASGTAPAEVFCDRGPGYVRLFGRASFADADMVAA